MSTRPVAGDIDADIPKTKIGYAAAVAVSTASVGSSSSPATRANVALSKPSRPRSR
jgi:hypothetical protein